MPILPERRGDLRVNTSGALENSLGQLIRNDEGGNVTIPPGFMARIADELGLLLWEEVPV